MAMQRKPAAVRAFSQPDPVPDIADLMNNWFFGAKSGGRRAQDPAGRGGPEREEVRVNKSNSAAGRSTQEWLADAKRMVEASPSRHESPTRFVGSPRFASGQQRDSPSLLDRRDPLSRSARRYRTIEGISDEILWKSNRHSRNMSEAFDATAIVDQQEDSDERDGGNDHHAAPPSSRPPKQPTVGRKTRFSGAQEGVAVQQPIPAPRQPAKEDNPLPLSPPKNLVESAHRRSISSSTCSQAKLPTRDTERRASRSSPSDAGAAITTAAPRERPEQPVDEGARQLNSFLRRQRAEIESICRGESTARAKIILSGSSNKSTTSSMVAAICYAWLLEKREGKEEGGGGEVKVVVAPVLNMRREKMWRHRQAAWLFHHVGIDAVSLLFADEIDLESLLMNRQLSMLVAGHDVLKTNDKVGSQCSVLTNDYCEDSYDLLQRTNLKRLLLAGILLDIQNLRNTAKFLTNRDTEAVQLLLTGFAPTYKDELLDQLMKEHKDSSFIEAMRNNYGQTPNDENHETKVMKPQDSVRTTTTPHQEANKANLVMQKSPKGTRVAHAENQTKMAEPTSSGKNKSFWGKLFGFRSK